MSHGSAAAERRFDLGDVLKTMRLLVSCMEYLIYSTWAVTQYSKFIMNTTALMCSMLVWGRGDLDVQTRLVQEELQEGSDLVGWQCLSTRHLVVRLTLDCR
ncbi:hypothetical protein SCLCIDRAFT_1210481 [Scleroderma citrinum Foug A]|uniref:Uncharacterized protein n=1 Tax=Scleroderma citrinum Foug A TaxID=1036808 RepID=A0A0C3EGH7_9AGAM|nr:hypothetical protein SCLCIDRAFT_1210481 [Scleroderma citrinum Foug A]